MTVPEINQDLVLILLAVLIVGVIILVLKIVRTLNNLNYILEDTHNVTSKISDFSDNPEKYQRMAQRYISETIDNTVAEQTYKFRRSFAREFLGAIIDQLRGQN